MARKILTESDEQIAQWKDRLQTALGINGRVITDIIPEVAFIIGEQPEVPVLSPEAAQNRFYLVFQNFVRVFASADHPLTLFLDDLQWADSSSLESSVEIQGHTFHFSIGLANSPPVADAGPDQTGENAVECTSPDGAEVTLDGSGSSDPDGDPLTFEWKDADENVVDTEAVITLTLGLGTHIFTLTVTDPSGESDSAIVQITVEDTTPAEIEAALNPVQKPKSSKSHKSSKDDGGKKAKDPREGHYKYAFDLGLTLEEVDGVSVRLVVSAVDASKSASGPVEVAPSSRRLSKPLLATKPVLGEEEATDEYTFGLGQNHPNPFNPVTMIRYSLGEQSEVRLVIYNVLGQQVRVLVDRVQDAGRYEMMWDSQDGLGRGVSSGLYLYRLQAGSNLAVRKMLFTK